MSKTPHTIEEVLPDEVKDDLDASVDDLHEDTLDDDDDDAPPPPDDDEP